MTNGPSRDSGTGNGHIYDISHHMLVGNMEGLQSLKTKKDEDGNIIPVTDMESSEESIE